jgi:hypothetical protein
MARLSTYTKDVNLTGKDMLAGSNYVTTVNGIDQFETNNFTLKKITEYINGQIITDPSIISLKTNGGLVYETVDDTNFLAVNLSHTNITGQLANSDLANSSITINGTEVSLGGTITIGEVTEVTAGTYLNGGGTEGAVTLNHDLTTRTDTTSTASPSYGDSFTVIDTLTTNSTGHVSAANVKTITLPASDDTTYTIEAIASTNDSIIRLVGSDSATDDVKLIAGSNITLSTSEANDTITISSQAFGNVYTVNSEAAMIAATSQAGDLVVRTDVSKTFIHNGGTTGTAADFTELQFSGINNIALTAGNGITLSRTSITNADNDLTITNALATSTTQGGVELFSDTEQTVTANTVTAEAGRTYGIQLNSDDQAVVNVPWVNTNTQNTTTLSFVDSGDDIILRNTTGGAGAGDQDINIVAGSNITLTHTDANNITIASTDTNTFRTVEVDTNGDDSANETLGAAETLRFKKGTNITLAESAGVITISSTDTNTTYSAGGGLDLTATTFSHTDTSSADNLEATARTYVSGLTFDTYGHVTAYATATETVTDTTRTDEEIRDVAAAQWVDGTNTTVVVDDDNNTIKINATDTNTTDWNFKVDTGTATNIAAGNTLTFTSGTNVTLAQTGNTIDISSTDTNTNTQNTYSISIPASTTKFRLTGAGHDGATTDDIEFAGSGATTVTRTSENKFTISSTDTNTNTQRSDEDIRDVAVAMLTAGSNITLTEDDANNTLTIAATDTNTQNTAAEIRTKVGTGNNGVVPAAGTAGHFLKHDGTFGLPSYTTNTNTEYTAGNGLSLSGTVFTATINYLSYSGSNNFMKSGADDRGTTVPDAGEILYLGTGNDEIISRARVDDLPFTNVTNNNQIANGAGYTTNTGTTTADNTQTFTNKSGNISQWTNDANYFSSAGGTFTGDIIISDADPGLTLNDSTPSSTSTSYTPSILFKADDVTKAIIGKTANNTNVFYAGYNYDGPVGIKATEIHSGHTHNPEYIFGYEPPNNGNTWGLQMKGDANTSNSLYMDPDANNHNSSIFFGGYTNALNVTRISHNQSLGLLLLDVPDAGTSNLSVKFRQYNTGGYMQNMIDFEDDGTINNATGSYGTISSDRRLKENIVNATSKLNDILSLEVKNFNFIGSDKKQIGLIAQDVEKVFPSWVNTRDNRIYKTHDEDGVPLEAQGELVSGLEDSKSLKVGMEFAVIVKVIQELNDKIESLEARIAQLETP